MSSKMSCISSNFSSFFLNSLNDASEFSKYLSNGELKCTNFEEFQVFGCGAPQSQPTSLQQQQQQLQYSHTHMTNGGVAEGGGETCLTLATATTALPTAGGGVGNAPTSISLGGSAAATVGGSAAASAGATPTSSATIAAAAAAGAALSNRWPTALATPNGHIHQSHHPQHPHPHHHHHHHHTTGAGGGGGGGSSSVPQHFDGSFEFIKYLRHSTDFSSSTSSSSNATESSNHQQATASTDKSSSISNSSKLTLAHTPPPPQSQSPVSSLGLIDLDSSTSQKSRSASRKVAALLSSVSRASSHSLVVMDSSSSALDVFDHDSKQTMFDMQHNITSNGSSNSNESSLELLAFPNSHLNASNSNTSSEGGAGEFVGLLTGCSGGSVSGGGSGGGGGGASCSSSTGSSASASHTPKLLGNFVIKENFDVHSSHKVEEGIFQHMNKLPPKKKDTLKQMGVRFTGQMTLTDKSIVVENFIKFCEEYDIKDHRPWLSLNQCGLNKPEQIKFARYLGQGLPTFTLFCIYSNFKNLFCTKRTEIYTKDGYNLPYILDKTKRFLANTTADKEKENTNNNNSNNSSNSNKSNNNKVNIKTNNTTTTSTPVKQTAQQQEQPQNPEQGDIPEAASAPPAPTASVTAAAPASPAAASSSSSSSSSAVLAATGGVGGVGGAGGGAAVRTMTPNSRPATPLMAGNAVANGVGQHLPSSVPLGQQQQQSPAPPLTPQQQQQQQQQQHHHQHPHPHPHLPPHHPQLHPHTPTRMHPQQQQHLHYPPATPPPPPPHLHQGHPHYAYPPQHHPHFYPHQHQHPHAHAHAHPHPHAHPHTHPHPHGHPHPSHPHQQQLPHQQHPHPHIQHMAAMGYSQGPPLPQIPSQQLQQQQQQQQQQTAPPTTSQQQSSSAAAAAAAVAGPQQSSSPSPSVM